MPAPSHHPWRHGRQQTGTRPPAIDVGSLPDQAAAELLCSVTGSQLAPEVVDRVLADTERNPLALVEIGSQYTAGELAARAYLPEPIPVGRQLQQRYLRRVHHPPPDVFRKLGVRSRTQLAHQLPARQSGHQTRYRVEGTGTSLTQ